MKIEIFQDTERDILCCNLGGELDVEGAIILSKNLRQQAAEMGFTVFYDARKLYVADDLLPDDFTTKLSTLVEKLSSLLEDSNHHQVKVAILYAPGEYDDYWKFYEDVAVSRGLRMRIFTDKEGAMEWLSK